MSNDLCYNDFRIICRQFETKHLINESHRKLPALMTEIII